MKWAAYVLIIFCFLITDGYRDVFTSWTSIELYICALSMWVLYFNKNVARKFNENSCIRNNHSKDVNCIVNVCNRLWTTLALAWDHTAGTTCEAGLQAKFYFLRLLMAMFNAILADCSSWNYLSLLKLDKTVSWGLSPGDLVAYLGFCFTLSPWQDATYWCYLILPSLYFLIREMGIIIIIIASQHW